MFLDVMEDIIKEVNISSLRPRIEHAQIIAPADLARFGTLGGMTTWLTLQIAVDWSHRSHRKCST